MKKILLCVILLFISLTLSGGEMINGTTNIYDSANGKKIGVLYDGTQIKRIDKQGSWRKIEVSFNNHRNILFISIINQ